MTKVFRNAVATVRDSDAPCLILLLPRESAGLGWCEQYTQEGYNVIHIPYPAEPASTLSESLASTKQHFPDEKVQFGLITFGLLPDDAKILAAFAQSRSNLKALVHYSPLLEVATALLVSDPSTPGKYIPTIFHLAVSQEKLHASLLPFSDPSNLSYVLPPSSFPPLAIHTYPLVAVSPPFPLLTKAPVLVGAGEKSSVDPYLRSATGLAYTRTLELFRRELGPHFDLEKLWGMHTYYEFVERDASKTMATMVKAPYVNHVPTMTGGVGYDNLARFYKHHFTSEQVTPPDTELITASRTVGSDRIIDEMIFKCTHTTEIDYFLPGVKPTGKPLEIALVGIVAFRGDKLTFEHIYWDQASVLVQLGILDPKGLPVAGVEVARKVVDPFGLPSNTLMNRWKESEGLAIN